MEEPNVKKWSASDISNSPHMEPEGVELLAARLSGAKVFLEYGAGGSTVFAASHGVESIYSVESDRGFLSAVSDKLSTLTSFNPSFTPVFVDLGPTGDWGVPTDKSTAERWPYYCSKVWDGFLANDVYPDVVLVDGRFRVACFLASLIFAKEGCTILFDDYTNRPHYHIVEKFIKPKSISGRMAEFVVTKRLPTKKIVLELIKHSTSMS
ncbi:hypothetical protein [Pseudomonas sp. CFBP 13719]|uniref:hypothetical protein n=1 Tax=Pseudomonas sp. CFBP 13719 TaxID=2775303 RepID=UPI00177E2A62|nr:hypothetical protein [Pseudomonas sp. CFBP 13719]MBD8680283.1 hypothetical protein [Pseudomonas sp. CFBP 13719]